MDETNLKVRLVGAIVLVSMAVIFIPMILDGREIAGTPVGESNIPPKPENGFISKVIPLTPTLEVKPVAAEKLVIKKGLSAQTTKTLETDAKPKAEPKIQAKPQSKPQSAPIKVAKVEKIPPHAGLSAWAVQIGSFDSKKNAYALQDKLRKKGFAAFVETIYTKDTPSFRVRVGPELKRELAENLRKKLTSVHKGRTFIVKHPS